MLIPKYDAIHEVSARYDIQCKHSLLYFDAQTCKHLNKNITENGDPSKEPR